MYKPAHHTTESIMMSVYDNYVIAVVLGVLLFYIIILFFLLFFFFFFWGGGGGGVSSNYKIIIQMSKSRDTFNNCPRLVTIFILIVS